MLDTILFDLDGTLLPMEMDAFMKIYFKELCAKCAPYGYRPDAMTDAVWHGTARMVRNDGKRPNEDLFWEAFAEKLGGNVQAVRDELVLFYENEFNRARAATRENPLAAPLVRGLRAKGYTVVLATNPLFPLNGVRTRLEWVGLTDDDFHHVTTYENSRFCKPNPDYYREVLAAAGALPQHSLMVGNHTTEDGNATLAGIPVYIVTDDLIEGDGVPLEGFEHGSFAACCAKLEGLPPVGA